MNTDPVERFFDVPEVLMLSPVVAALGFWLECSEEVYHVSPHWREA
jgi:hypothetical protein